MIIPTTSYSSPQGGFGYPDPKGPDPYTDLFAALFTFPVPVPVQHEPLILDQPILGGEATDVFAPTVSSDHPGFTINADPAKNDVGDILGLFPKAAEPVDQKIELLDIDRSKIGPGPESPVSLLGPPVKESKPAEANRAEAGLLGSGLEIDGDVCGLPADDPDIKLTPRFGKPNANASPVSAESLPVEKIRLDDDDQLVEVEVLELPVIPPVTHWHDDREAKPDNTPLDLSGLDAVPVDTLVANEIRTPTRMQYESDDELPATFPDAVSKHSEKVSLLETFTTNVLTDGQSVIPLTGRSGSKGQIDIDGVLPGPVKAPEEKISGEQPAEFSFGSALNGDNALGKIEKPITSETKLKRIILDQVGSAFMDLARSQKETGDKRVLKIRLSPAELGTVEITLAKNADGMIDAHFQTDNPKTQHVLQESLAQLRESLERSGMQVGSLNTSCTSFSSGGHGNDDARQPQRTTFDDQTGKIPGFEAAQKADDDKLSRLVNLRA